MPEINHSEEENIDNDDLVFVTYWTATTANSGIWIDDGWQGVMTYNEYNQLDKSAAGVYTYEKYNKDKHR